MDIPMIIWLVLFVLMVGLEISTLQLVSVWFACGCVAAFFVALAGIGIEVQVVVFLAVSFLLLLTVKPLATKYLKPRVTKTNADSLIGQTAKVTSLIDNTNGYGSAVVNGMEWTAAAEGDQVFEPGVTVRIKAISGVKLIVTENKED